MPKVKGNKSATAQAKRKHSPPPVRVVGWILLTLGLAWLIPSGFWLLFVISTEFTPEVAVTSYAADPSCIEAATATSTACPLTFTGTITSEQLGASQSYTTQAEFDAALEALRAGERTRATVWFLPAVALSSLGLALVAMGHSPKTRQSRRRTASARG